MITIRFLTENNKKQYFSVLEIVEQNLENKNFWLPVSDEERKTFFDQSKILQIGAFEGEKLVGALGLYIDESVFGSAFEHLEIKNKTGVAKVGRAMVLPEFRRKKILHLMMQTALEKAKSLNFNCVFAIAHPQNIASCSYLKKIGFKALKTFTTPNGYLRNLYFLDNLN